MATTPRPRRGTEIALDGYEPYYDDGQVTLFLADCLDLMPLLTCTVDMVLADLPFGTTRAHWDRPLDWKQLWHAYHGLTRPGAATVLFGSGGFTADAIVSNRREWRYNLVWAKVGTEEHPPCECCGRTHVERTRHTTGQLNAKKQPLRQHEDLAVFYRCGRQPTYNPQLVYTGRTSHSRGSTVERTNNHYGDYVNTPLADQPDGWQHPSSVLEFPRPKPPKGKGHPSQKPVALAEWAIRTWTDEGDLVLDNVCGSATTLVAARNTGRRAIGIELNEQFAERAAERLASGSTSDRW